MRIRAVCVAIAIAVLSAACGDDSPSSPSRNGSVSFRLDQNSCTRVFGTSTLSFTFFVDGVSVGTTSLGIGITSPSYTVTPGSHIASASVTNTALRFENLSFSVQAGGTFTYILIC